MQLLKRYLVALVGNTLAVLIGLVMAVLLGEGFVRLFSPCPDYGGGIRPAFYSNLFEYDALLGWKGVRNLSTPYYSKDFRVHVSHDADGYRNIYPPYVEGRENFLLLGDSYAWGWGVNDDETAAAVFTSKHPSMNMYSLGLAGYGTDQEWLALQRHIEQHQDYHYRKVILLFYANDFDDNAASERYAYPKPMFSLVDGSLQLTNVPVPYREVEQSIPVDFFPPELEGWSNHLQILNFLAYSIKAVIEGRNIWRSGDESPKVIDADLKGRIVLTRQLLSGINRYCKGIGIPFHVVILQTHDTTGRYIAAENALTGFLEEDGVAHSVFKSRRIPNTDLWLDAHYSPYGQSLLADHLAGIIAQDKQDAGVFAGWFGRWR